MQACWYSIDPNHKIGGNSEGTPFYIEKSKKLVGKLIYLSHARPDIAYAVSVVSQFMHAPRSPHLEAVFRILRYLKSAPGKGLLFANYGHLKVEAYTDAEKKRGREKGYSLAAGSNNS